MTILSESAHSGRLLNKRLRIGESEFRAGNPTFLALQKSTCSAPDYLYKLIKLRESISTPALGSFLDTLFSDNNITFPFITLPASTRHHHPTASGLLIHSVECTEIASRQPFKSQVDRDITVVAALLHDIGKVRSYTTSLKTTELGRIVAHDHLTLEACAKALSSLDISWPEGANTLRHIWTCCSDGARYGFNNLSLAYKTN